jgi:CBS domain-containing protein
MLPRASAETLGQSRRERAMLVRDVMQRDVAVIGPDASLALAARTMRDQDIGCLPVIEHGQLIGMISDRDIVVRGMAGARNRYRDVVRDVMSTRALTCSAEDSVDQARDLMATNLIKNLPVLDRRKRLVGLISLRDISGQDGRYRPPQVTFYKRLATSSGHVRNVELATVYLSPAIKKDDIVPAAVARFEHDRGLACWKEAADLYELGKVS